ncbi:carbohydrate ABC transporter permease [Paenibacillus sp. GCM10027626]|uniref:carbohydrate ABC transporter permease n=1 Tax=Paenibacillus sp. GCM10027626 TaxID=3273411 RepID=UPI003628B6AB
MGKRSNTLSARIFDGFNYLLLVLFALCSIIPFLYIIGGSFATEAELSTRGFFLIPTEYSLNAYKYIFTSNTLIRSIMVSIYVTAVGTVVNLFFTVTMAYPLARRTLHGRNTILNLVVFSMLFSGGLIPTFLIVKSLGLLDTYWALMLPGAISAFNLIIVKNFFQELPPGLEESARIDGCTEVGVLWKIVLPLSKPVLATFGMFYAVGHWNNFFTALLYVNSPEKWPLQVLLRQIVLLSQGSLGDSTQMDHLFEQPPEQAVKMAAIVVGTVPILLVYPFLQKHFAKGILLGSVKG